MKRLSRHPWRRHCQPSRKPIKNVTVVVICLYTEWSSAKAAILVLEISQILQNQQKNKMADLALLYSLKAQVVIEFLTFVK